MADSFWGSGNPLQDLQRFGQTFYKEMPKDRDILDALGIPGAQATKTTLNRPTRPSGFADIRGSDTPGSATPAVVPELGYGGYARVAGVDSGLAGQPANIRWKSDPKTAASAGGGISTSPTRAPRTDVPDAPSTVEEAYALRKDPGTYGGRRLGDLSDDGFIDASAFKQGGAVPPGMTFDQGVTFNDGVLGDNFGQNVDLDKYKGAFTGSAENAGDAFTTDYSNMVFKEKPRDSLAALQQGEKNAGLLRSGSSYYIDGPDGMQKITQGMAGVGEEGQGHFDVSRDQALAFAASQADGGVKAAETAKNTLTAGTTPGGSPAVSDAEPGIAQDMNFGSAVEASSDLGNVEGLTGAEGRRKMQDQVSKARTKQAFAAGQLKDLDNTFKNAAERDTPLWGSVADTTGLVDNTSTPLDPLWGSGGIVADRPAGPLW